MVVVVCAALLLLGLPAPPGRNPWHPATGGPAANASERAPTSSDPGAPPMAPSSRTTRRRRRSPSAAGALACWPSSCGGAARARTRARGRDGGLRGRLPRRAPSAPRVSPRRPHHRSSGGAHGPEPGHRNAEPPRPRSCSDPLRSTAASSEPASVTRPIGDARRPSSPRSHSTSAHPSVRERGPGCSSSIEPFTRRAPRVSGRPSGARHPPCEVPMKRVIMSIVLLASTAVAEGQDRVQQAPAPPSDSQEAASPPPPVLLEPVVVTAPPPVSSSSELYHPGPRLRAAAAGPARRHPAPRARAHHRPARGRREGRAVLPARVRRRPRHRRRALRRRLPVNLRSHAHGQGYADLHFLIPETLKQVDVYKGPYFVEFGDFATAGAINFVTLDTVPENIARGRGRELGHPALPHAPVAHSRPAEDALRRRGLHHQRPLRAAAGLHPLQRVRQGDRPRSADERRLLACGPRT